MKLTSIEAIFVSTFHSIRLDFREISQKWSYWFEEMNPTIALIYCSQADNGRTFFARSSEMA